MNHHLQPAFSPRRELGRTGFVATAIGIGDLADRSVPLEQCVDTLCQALAHGLNLIDTAPMYEDGYSEQIVGTAVTRVTGSNGRGAPTGTISRDDLFVIDKIDELDRPVRPQAEASLQRLGLDRVDLFVLHALSTLDDWNKAAAPGGSMDQIGELIRSGRCRFCGISSHDPHTLRAAIESGLCDVVMFPVGPFVDSRYIDEILPLARQKSVGTVCFKAFGAGKLLGDTQGYGRPLQNRPRGKLSSGGLPEPAVGHAHATTGDEPLAEDASPMLPRLTVEECVHFAMTCDPDVVLLGMSFPNEIEAALAAAAGFKPLDHARMAEIRLRAARAIEGKGECWWNPVGR
ncbi:MAG TPA: aldo/keto reductase [Phycisphaerae bacterium]|nr:aldo/keto reductase [Phycisphaerae bacterium]HPP27900.1 aldo/keto reductase [Phycisphaerae bacterium]HQE26159.1 aldo/keto reductase [Phycisphaerae bacterium]